jgi:Tfp pilus tip-associated adhesin PilY1
MLLVLILCPSSRARAQADDIALLQQSVPPNVVLLLDTSGSMRFGVNADEFTSKPNRDNWMFNDRFPLDLTTKVPVGGSSEDEQNSFYCDLPRPTRLANTGGVCPGSKSELSYPGEPADTCPNTDDYGARWDGEDKFYCTNVPTGCQFAPPDWDCYVDVEKTYLTPPDYGKNKNYATGWQRNYLYWVVQQMHAGNAATYHTGDRIGSAKDAIRQIIDNINPDGQPDAVRFGLARFDRNNKGAYLLVGAGDGTKSDIFARLVTTNTGWTSTHPNGGTPLSEALVDIGRYYAGTHRLGVYDEFDHSDAIGGVPPSPIDAFCRLNFVIVLTDGQPTSDLNDHHSGTNDFMNTIGNADGDDSENPDPWTGSKQLFVPPYATNSGSDWLDDVAYYLSHTDLVPDAVMQGDQVVYTYTVGFAIDHPLLAETADNGDGRYFTTSNADELVTDLTSALDDIIERASSLTAATVPSSRSAFGDGFYTAFFRPRANDHFWPGHLQAFRLSPDLEVLDRPRAGFPFGGPAIDPLTNLFYEPRFPFWDTGEQLLSALHPPRNLYTNLTSSRAPATFDVATITANHLGVVAGDLLLYDNDPAVPFADEEALADGLVSYLRGTDTFDKDRDGDTTEKRSAVLGDIFHSNPIAIGPPPAALRNEDGFGPIDLSGTFLNTYKQRSRRIYVGANDGMLHAFDGGDFRSGDNPNTPETEQDYYDLGTGQESFGYIPGFSLDKLKLLPRNDLAKPYFVDGNASAADVWLPADATDVTKESSEWATVLVTAMRQGGRGYFALDVTDPTAVAGSAHFPYPKFLWEIDESSLPFGETWSEAIITRIKLRGPGANDYCGHADDDDGSCVERWVAIVSAGYDATGDPNYPTYVGDPSDPAWTDAGKGVFILDVKTGAVIAKKTYYDPADPALTNPFLQRMTYAMPSTPGVLDLDFDGFADVIYVGDLGGQIWKWDIHEVGMDTIGGDGLVDNWEFGVFFSARPSLADPLGVDIGDVDGDGSTDFHYHSIYFPPIATYVDDKLVLGFGSGERSDLDYVGQPGIDDNNRFWVVWDRTPVRSCVARDAFDNCTSWTDPHEIELFEGYQIDSSGQSRGINDITGLLEDDLVTDDGYYIVAPDGEKFITNHIVFAGILLTLSYVPETNPSDVCNTVGTTNVWLFDVARGLGLLGASDRADALGNGAPADPRISVSRDSNGDMSVELIGQTSLGEVLKLPIPGEFPDPVEFVYWRQRF